jgi:hypothetical protein
MMRSFRRLTVVVVVAAILIPTLTVAGTALASTRDRHRPAPKAHTASGSWECTIVGGVVAAGVGASFVNPGLAAITATLAWSGFTAGCEIGANHNPRLISGLPRSGNCWYVWQHHWGVPHRHRAYTRRVEECWA